MEGGLPSILINDGKIINKNLEKLGYSREWLAGELKKYGVIDMKNVYLATIDGSGKIYYSLVN
ncbi:MULTISPECIES: YetF domain-containing protein [Bacillota]|uniref:YetF domain-containing protein n=1 Tax=Bacillota TaxID=1239 RepID=UPI0039EFC72B